MYFFVLVVVATARVVTLVEAPDPCLKYPYGSQKGQDQWVVKNTEKSNTHFFVDLAANRPECLSNSVVLERKYGWKGLCIEANGDLAQLLRAERSCTVIEAPIAETTREIVFYLRSSDAFGGIVGKGMDNEIVPAAGKLKRLGGSVKHMTTQRLDAVLRSANAPNVIDYLSLDVEGAEDDVLCDDFPFDEFTFLLATIERPPPSLNRRLFNNGYLFVKNHEFDTFYVHVSHPHATDLERNDTFTQIPAHKHQKHKNDRS